MKLHLTSNTLVRSWGRSRLRLDAVEQRPVASPILSRGIENCGVITSRTSCIKAWRCAYRLRISWNWLFARNTSQAKVS